MDVDLCLLIASKAFLMKTAAVLVCWPLLVVLVTERANDADLLGRRELGTPRLTDDWLREAGGGFDFLSSFVEITTEGAEEECVGEDCSVMMAGIDVDSSGVGLVCSGGSEVGWIACSEST